MKLGEIVTCPQFQRLPEDYQDYQVIIWFHCMAPPTKEAVHRVLSFNVHPCASKKDLEHVKIMEPFEKHWSTIQKTKCEI